MPQRIQLTSTSNASSVTPSSATVQEGTISEAHPSWLSRQNGSNHYGGKRKRRSKREKSTRMASLYALLIWALAVTIIFFGMTSSVHLLKQEGKLSNGLTLTAKTEDPAMSKLFFGEPVSHSSKQRTSSDVTESKARFFGHFPEPPKLAGNRRKPLQLQQNWTKKYYAFDRDKRNQSLQHITNQFQAHQGTPRMGKPVQVSFFQSTKKQKTVHQKEIENGDLHPLDYYYSLSGNEGHDKQRVLDLIRDNAGVNVLSQSTYYELPTWSQITSMYGTGPRLIGRDQCAVFQADGDLGDKFLAVSGMFNSGTNLLSTMLVRNCVLHHRQEKYGIKHRGVRWQVPWGKHTPPKDEEFRLNHVAQKSEGVDAKQVLPAVAIRDPFRWLQSMCSHHYTSRWPRVFEKDDPKYHCPNLVPTRHEKLKLARHGHEPIVDGSALERETSDGNETDTTDENKDEEDGEKEEEETEESNSKKVDRSSVLDVDSDGAVDLNLHYFPVSVTYSNFTRHHYSLVHLWNEWYEEYIKLADYPRILVRMEDLLFFPDQAIPPICECAGGKLVTPPGKNRTHVKITAESAKKNSVKLKPGEEHTNYIDALIRYGNPKTLVRGFTQQDLQYTRRYLDQRIMELFGYHLPEI